MELGDLKSTWQDAGKQQTANQNIMEMIHQKSRGPVESLKHSFRKQTRFILCMMIVMIATQIGNMDSKAAIILTSTYIIFCIGIATFFYINYRLTGRLEGMDGNVKTNLEQYVSVMKQRMKWHDTGIRIVGLIFVLLLELLPLFLHARMLDKWHSLSPFIRFTAYAAFFLLQYFVGGSVQRQKFGQHLMHLQKLLTEIG